MKAVERTVNSEALGEQISFIRTGEETGGELLEMEACYAAGQDIGEMLMHYHPNQDEEFEVLEGVMTVELNGVRRHYVAGQRFSVPRNTVHGMRNCGSVPARIHWEVRPALQTQEFFETILPLADTGELYEATRMAQLFKQFGHVFRLATPA